MEDDIRVRIEYDPILHGMGQLLENQATLLNYIVHTAKDISEDDKSILSFQARITERQGWDLQRQAYAMYKGGGK